ncbi:hypothetical protein D0437_30890 [Bacillus cereus]|uniref:Uncharacterized protein n=1 Tax=Bacillus cereus TaxID=1396 RepID=A0A9X7M1Y6_BACCE|nr:hypothetical protein D0437_30890 [Bacillus cereus]
MVSNGTRLNLPTGEGAPSKSEGVGGVFVIGGLGESSPVGLDNVQGLYILWLAVARHFFAEAKTKRGIGGNPRQAVFAPRSG